MVVHPGWTVFETLMVMIAFGTLTIAILSQQKK
ncbi:putative holin-like toxin [Oceanobacillus kapialis]|uniref:Holin-like toxin n=1 Tax=Oceanobacillus kapialis TaxID=481353 RepID=A0ABW5PX24_9BACI